jgi:prolyl-tRNA synthetase
MVFPDAIAPFRVALVPIGLAKSAQVRSVAETLYLEISAAGIDIFLDDRDERTGVMLADMELIGIPHRIVVSERGLRDGVVEYQGRCDASPQKIPVAGCQNFLLERLR